MTIRTSALALFSILFAAGCSKDSAPIQPPVNWHRITILSHPASSSLAIGGGSNRGFTPANLDTVAGSYAIRLSMLGYSDTSFAVAVPATPDTIRVTLRPLPGTPRAIEIWPVLGSSTYANAHCLALDVNERVYVVRRADSDYSIQAFAQDGAVVGTWPFLGHGSQYSAAVTDPVGQLYVAPRYPGLVTKFDGSGTVIGYLGAGASFNTEINGLAIDASGDSLFVATEGVIRVISSLGGVLLRSVQLEATRPFVTTTHGAFARDAAGYLYCATAPGDSIYKLNAVGQRVAAWGMPGMVHSMAFAPNGDHYAALAPADLSTSIGKAPGRIVRLGPTGAVLGQWATPYMAPTSIAVAPDGDIHVSSFYVGVVKWSP